MSGDSSNPGSPANKQLKQNSSSRFFLHSEKDIERQHFMQVVAGIFP